MNKVMSKTAQRILAAAISVIMLFSMIPISAVNVLAATAEHLDAVTITVEDSDGNAISGASVDFSVDSVANGNAFKTGNQITDANGTVEVMPSADYVPDDLTVSATVSKAGYKSDSATISNASIDAEDEDFKVQLISTVISDVTVTPTSVPYDGEDHAAATVTGTKTGDIVSYKLNSGDWQDSMPTVKEPNTYSLKVKVERTDFDVYETTVAPVISLNTISLNITEYVGNYDEASHPALTVDGLLPTDTVTYSINGEAATTDIPEITNVGSYTVTVHVERYGYNNYDQSFTNVKIDLGTINLGDLSATAYDGVYDDSAHNAVSIKNEDTSKYSLSYRLDGGSWSSEIPKVKDAGQYTVEVKVVKDQYNDGVVNVIPADKAVYPFNVYIAKADQTITFDNYSGAESNEEIVGLPPFNKTYNFAATDVDNLVGDPISYSIELSAEDTGIATIDAATGVLTVTDAGTIIVKATLPGNGNYNECVVTHTLYVSAVAATEGQYVKFNSATASYIIGETSGVAATNSATKVVSRDYGTITYSIENKDIGLSCNSTNGKITVSDYNKLSNALINAGGSLNIAVTANKSKWTKKYPADKATYILTVSFLDTPSDTYEIAGTKGTNDWFISEINVTAKDSTNYTISKEATPSSFGTSVTYSNQGTDLRYVYLRNTVTGGITSPIALNGVKIDTVKPDYTKMSVTYSDSIVDTVLSAITLGFYKPSVTVTFTAEDVTAGVDHFDWTYTKQAGQSDKNKPTDGGSVLAVVDGDKATAQIVLTAAEAAQYRGSISFTATDKAGNESETVTDNDYVLVVDTISPTRNVVISNPKATTDDNTMYFDGDTTITFNVNEANFFEDDVKVTVSKDSSTPYAVTPIWEDTNIDEHVGTLVLSGDGDYVVYMQYTDRSTNEMESYQSDVLTIDTTAPIIDFSYDRENQSTTFTVTEHNFRAEDISVSTVAKDITGAAAAVNDLTSALHSAQWSKDGDIYTVTISDYIDAIYDLTISYTDISKNKAEDKQSSEFIIDHSAPTGTKIEYSKSILDTVLETLTLGFYNPDVTVTFTAYDKTSGVDTFTWNYTQQSGSSSINRPTDTSDSVLEAVQDTADKTKFSKSITLPLSEAEQLRGYIAVVSTDTYANAGDKVTDDGEILVVDTIAPTMNVEYSSSSRTVGTNMYYNKAATATFTVNEANFFADDVKVTVSKNGGAAYAVVPSWSDNSVDVHVGTLVLPAAGDHSNDGHYVISVTYTDRSSNTMTTYTSDTITIDTINPTVDVQYANTEVKNTLNDSEGNERKYFDNTQTATIIVTEHNFNADEVDFNIIAKDVTGAELSTDNLISKSAWTSSGDNHTIVITYSGDANYTFDVDYTDLATNKMADYNKDFFTVDKTAPANLTVSYSTSVLDTILESISFGFYNAKMTVTITADDVTSKINAFDYSYLNAAGVSAVNSGLLSQVIEEAGITYSNNNATATTSFEIPKMVLGNDNQFNGTVEFTAKDRSKNSTENKDSRRIVVDNIAPTATITYNAHVNTENGISYYDGDINASINITEANFYANDVSVMVQKDGGAAYAVTPSWSDNSVDSHVGTFTLTEDGDYIVTVSYKDKSNNSMAAYSSEQLTIDTIMESPVITINDADGNGKAYKDKVVPSVSFNDENYDSYEVSLTRTNLSKHNEDVKEKFVGSRISETENGGSGSFDTFEKIAENDGIYTLSVTLKDKAGHTSEPATTVFTVNRFGSVYEYNTALYDLIADGGAYVQNVSSNLVITEYNADRLIKDSLAISVTRDGKPLSDLKVESSPINNTVSVGESGWFQYEYTLDRENFEADGVYRISVSSKDATGNQPENTNYEDKDILFRVDSTAPELTSVTGLEEKIINAQNVDVGYNVYDTIGLKSITVYVNGEQDGETITDFTSDQNNYNGKFVLNESNSTQTVRLVVEDMAGNITDTDSDSFTSAYAFEKEVTVSTNIFVRWYANTVLFWGSIGGVVLLAAAISILVYLKKKKTKTEQA